MAKRKPKPRPESVPAPAAAPSAAGDLPSGKPVEAADEAAPPARPVCQLCGGPLIEIRAKLQCQRCHTLWETCCEGGRW